VTSVRYSHTKSGAAAVSSACSSSQVAPADIPSLRSGGYVVDVPTLDEFEFRRTIPAAAKMHHDLPRGLTGPPAAARVWPRHC
jgi:hypothetical protein